MGFVSPSASAKRRIAPFSTSLTDAFDSRPMALRSTKYSSHARGQVQDGDEAGLRAGHQGGGVGHGPRGGLVARHPAGDDAPEAGIADQLDLVARVGGAERD